MRKFKQNKLWRDKAVDLMQSQGSIINWHRLSTEEFQIELKTKLVEEAHEVLAAKDKQKLVEELADVLEVIEALAQANDISQDVILTEKAKKIDHRGGFTGRKFVESAEHPQGSFGEKYCLAEPEKYPEII